MMRALAVLGFILLSGCAAVGTIAALPGVLVEELVHQFKGAERSIPTDIHRALAAVQQGLRSLHLDADLLERLEPGYAIVFSNEQIEGKVMLRSDTPKLTTIYIQVHRGLGREESVEKAILDVIEQQAPRLSRHARFDFRGYGRVYDKTTGKAKRIGWFRIGSRLEVAATGTEGWLRIKMPSGRNGYMQARIGQFRHKTRKRG